MRLFLFLLLSCPIAAQTSDTAFVAQIAAHREQYKQEFLTDEHSPLTAQDTALLDFFPADPAWRVKAHVVAGAPGEPFDMSTYSGKTVKYREYATVEFVKDSQTYRLHLYQNLRLSELANYHDYVFLPFKDLTNGESSYAGGRYIDLKLNDMIQRNGQLYLYIDFNKCYNPYCAYSDGYNCPVPPQENRLALKVNAGERNFKGEKKH